MAFSVNSLFSWLKGFLSSMPSPLGGFGIDDVKMNNREGEYSVLYQFGSEQSLKDDRTKKELTDVHGEKIELSLLLATVNVQEAFAPLLSGLNKIDTLNQKDASAVLAVFLGTGRENESVQESIIPKYTDPIFADTNNESSAAKGGLLGTKLDNDLALATEGATYAGKTWSWMNVANDMLKYALECSVPGKDYGAIENVPLENCSKLISEYLVGQKVVANADEVKIDPVELVRPLLCRIQIDLKKYYDDAYNKYSKIKEIKDTYEEDEKAAKDAEAEKQKAAEDAEKSKIVEIYEYDDNGNLQPTGQSFDKTTSDGVAAIKELAGHGYVGEGGADLMSLVASKQINVTLKKITATSDIEMLALDANYLPSEVLNDLEDILDQDDFVATVTEDPQTYAIAVDDDGFDIETCDCCKECDPCASLCEVFKSGIRAYRNLYILHWMSSGNDMMKLHNLSEEMYGELFQEIDTVGELLVEKQGTVPQLDFPCDYIPVQKYDFQTGLDQIKSLVQMYIDCIDYAYCNQDSDVQSTLDEWLRYWNKQLNYFVKNQEI